MGLDTVELVFAVENEFDIEIDNEEAAHILTVGELLDCVTRKLKEAGRAPNEEEIFQRLKAVFFREQRIEPERIVRGARIVKDLGLD